ncbi:MAG: hypothetical protein PHY08_13350 [Candidatus Cloacimonetes bacterium]|jgi:hypothetical protein|nr:hypothetical protein [Candidatus Cloacimonadota bacterium]
MSLKTIEILLNIFSYAVLALICVTVVKIGLKILGIKIFSD